MAGPLMARIRTIKPDFFTDELMAELPITARLTYIGLWTHVDDDGRCVDNAALVKAAVWPLDVDHDAAQVEKDLLALSERGRIHRYEGVEGRRFLHVVTWSHQKIAHPTPSRLAPCPTCANENLGNPPENIVSPPEVLAPDREQGKEQGTGNREQGVTISAHAETAEKLCRLLAELIEANGSKRPQVTKAWHDAARLAITRDGRTPTQLEAAIRWSQTDEFWRTNILSMPTLRRQYDRLRLAASRPTVSTDKLDPLRRTAERWQRDGLLTEPRTAIG